MPGLKKADFDEQHRFRECREIGFRESRDGLVNCVSCTSMAGEAEYDKDAFCGHEGRVRRVKLADPLGSGFGSWNIASRNVCDAYGSKPLPEEVDLPVLPKGYVFVLGTQWRDIWHADPNCPYVREELRMMHAREQGVGEEALEEGERHIFNGASIETRDVSDLVYDETVGDQICEMPCCNDRLPYHTWRVDDYRRKAGITPDGREDKIWVRKWVDHERKVEMKPEEVEEVFDLSRFNSSEFGDIHGKISAASDHLDGCNRLGSMPLSEAINPVRVSPYHSFCDPFWVRGPQKHLPLVSWIYDWRLFDKKDLEKYPLDDLQDVPDGFIPCVDLEGHFSEALIRSRNDLGKRFYLSGILRSVEPEIGLPKNTAYFLDIKAAEYHGYKHMWGVFGNGFGGLASFHKQ